MQTQGIRLVMKDQRPREDVPRLRGLGEHTAPWECTYAKEDKNRCKLGKKPASDQEYFEILCLCVLQAGLSWNMLRKNWHKYRIAFLNFDIETLTKMRVEELLERPDVIRNPKKIEGIIHNATEFQRIKLEYGSFSGFLRSQKRRERAEVIGILKNLFKHVGTYTAEFYLHSVGFR